MAGRILVALSRGIDRLASALAMMFLVVLVGAVMTQVIARYVLQSPPAWTEELARYTMIWAGLMGATMSFKRRFDPALIGSASADRPAWLTALTGGIQGLAVLIYLLPILWFSFFGPNMNPERSFLVRHSRMTAETLGFPTLLVAVAVPLMIVFILIHLMARPFEREQPHPEQTAPERELV